MHFDFLSLKTYFLTEFDSLWVLVAGGGVSSVSGKGLFGRTEGYIISLAALFQYPLGTFQGNVMRVVEQADIDISTELTYFFSIGVYGLKNYLSNLAVTGGFPGLIAYFFFLGFLLKGFTKPCLKQGLKPCILLKVALVLSIVFSGIIEERYFVPAYAVLLLGLASYFCTFFSEP